MLATNYSNMRQKLAHYCDEAVDNLETIVVTRKNDRNVVLMSESEYNNLMENIYIRSNATDYQMLLDSIKEIKDGGGEVHELAAVNADE